ncbi:MAG: TfoX/Sxy family protein [Peptococcaceae bacterium]|nr:TfoX/Sxy family protein [Peptococcaceae bacterium]
MADLTTMRNIGEVIAKKLKSVGITTAEELRQAGSQEAFVRLTMKYPNTCLVTLYALEGAITDTDYSRLPEDTKQDLKTISGAYPRLG